MIPRLLVTFLALAGTLATSLAAAPQPALNQLTAQEKAAGWQLLFDGQTFAHWRGYRQKTVPEKGWLIKDGLLSTVAGVKGGVLITQKKFNDFEFSWEWRVAEAGNNGVKYLVTEDRPGSPGPEYQMIDDVRHPDGKKGPTRQTAAFYDVLPPVADKPSRPAGEWNSSRIVVKGKKIEHWLNGKNVLTYELGSPAVKAGLAASKFNNAVGFGEKIAGHIMLTYHNDECWFRNLKIRELK